MERCMVDTNVVLRLLNPADARYPAAQRAIDRAIDDGYRLCITHQIVTEFWNVATRPLSVNGLGWSVS